MVRSAAVWWAVLVALVCAARPAHADVKCINIDLPLPSSGLREFVGQSVCIVVAKPSGLGAVETADERAESIRVERDHSEQAAAVHLGAAVGALAVTVTPAPATAILPGLLMLRTSRRRR